jgi:hypothetical protein
MLADRELWGRIVGNGVKTMLTHADLISRLVVYARLWALQISPAPAQVPADR